MRVTDRGIFRRLSIATLPAAALAGMLFAPATAATPTPTTEVQVNMGMASAIAEASVVPIQIEYSGFVHVVYGEVSGWQKTSIAMSCSGVALPGKNVLTAGHCVDKNEAKRAMAENVAKKLIKAIDASPSFAADLLESSEYWNVEGRRDGTSISRVVTVGSAKAASGIDVLEPTKVSVTKTKVFEDGDLALLHSDAFPSELPAIQVAPTDPEIQSLVVSAGYPGSVTKAAGASLQPSMKQGNVSGERTFGSGRFYETSAALSSGMSGGPVVNSKGELIGINSWHPGEETQPFNFFVARSAIADFLTSNNVPTAVAQQDIDFRNGLKQYFDGHYRAADVAFAKVLAASPSHRLAQQYKTKAVANFPNEVFPPEPKSNTWLIILVAFVALVLVAIVAVVLFAARRRSSAKTQHIDPAAEKFRFDRGLSANRHDLDPSDSQGPSTAEQPPVTAPIATRRSCVECGSALDVDDKFCGECGTRTRVARSDSATRDVESGGPEGPDYSV